MLKPAYNTPRQAAGDEPRFQSINPGYNSAFRPNQLSLGLVVPLERYSQGPVPSMNRHIERVKLAEELGFCAVWLRDIPFNVPSFGDAGQIYDPFVYLGLLVGQTTRIALGVASIVLPLRHPAHVAKAAASVDVLSGGRLILGVASGDRPDEYPALNLPFADRGARFRAAFDYIERMWEDAPAFENPYGSQRGGMDMLPKPTTGRLPLLITGGSQQEPDWIARRGDGWITYPRAIATQARIIDDWRTRIEAVGGPTKPAVTVRGSDQRSTYPAATDPSGIPGGREPPSHVSEIASGDRREPCGTEFALQPGRYGTDHETSGGRNTA